MDVVATAYYCIVWVLLGLPVVFVLYALAGVLKRAIGRQPRSRRPLWLLISSVPVFMAALGVRVVSNGAASVGAASMAPIMRSEHLMPHEDAVWRAYRKSQSRLDRERFHVGLTYVIMPRGIPTRVREAAVARIEHQRGGSVTDALAGLHLPGVRVIGGDHNWTRGAAVGILIDARYTVVFFFTPRVYKPRRVFVRIVLDGIPPYKTGASDYISVQRIKYDGKNYLKIQAMDRSIWCPRGGSRVLEVVPQPDGDAFLLCATFSRKVGP